MRFRTSAVSSYTGDLIPIDICRTQQSDSDQAIIAFLESTGYEDAVRNAISLGGDADTLACITGGIAEAYYGVPRDLSVRVRAILDPLLIEVVDRFQKEFRLDSCSR